MKIKKTMAFITLAIGLMAGVLQVSAETKNTGIKNYILLDTYDSQTFLSNDINRDGKVNVLDFCRLKSDILQKANEVYDVNITLGDIYSDYDNHILYVPIIINNEKSYDISSVNCKFNFEIGNFSMNSVSAGDFFGRWIWSKSDSKGISNIKYTEVQGMKNSGTVLIAELKIKDNAANGVYKFSLSDVSVVIREDGNDRTLSADECPLGTGDKEYFIDIDKNPEITTAVTSVTTSPDVTEIKLPENSSLDETSVYNAMIALKAYFPEGTPWTNSDVYRWNGSFVEGHGCAAFAFMLSDAAFGTLPARDHHDESNIRVGDILRVNNNGHSVIVLEVTNKGVIVAEGNYNESVHWGREISWDELKGDISYITTRYPE